MEIKKYSTMEQVLEDVKSTGYSKKDIENVVQEIGLDVGDVIDDIAFFACVANQILLGSSLKEAVHSCARHLNDK